MKIIGHNKTVMLTEKKAKYWIEHQVNQRAVIDRHSYGLAKLLARTGWRNDQRLCITEDDRIVNGLQRLSAIIKLGDFGWDVPVTVYKNDELTNDVIESFNAQKGDSITQGMRRLYQWKDKRRSAVCGSLYAFIGSNTNPTTSDYLDIYECLKKHFDKVMKISEPHNLGYKRIDPDVYASGILCSLEGFDVTELLNQMVEYANDNRSCIIWRTFKQWDMDWSKEAISTSGNCGKREPGGKTTRMARRFITIRDFISGKKIRNINKIRDEEITSATDHIREMIRNNIEPQTK